MIKSAMPDAMQPDPICQTQLPHLAWMDPRTRRLPGIQRVEGDDWLRLDEAYAGQMALRDRLIADRPDKVHALLPQGRAAAQELYRTVLAWLRSVPGFTHEGQTLRRPDGVTVPLDPDQPLLTLGRLVQEDLCLLQDGGHSDGGEGYVLTGAALCFPASWTLAQKIGRPMTAIHDPVLAYDADLARRVDRMFVALRPEQPLWRMNFLTYDDFTLHQPRREGESRPQPKGHGYVRSERQCLLRLPQSRAVVFSIHTYVVDASTVPGPALAELRAALQQEA